MCAISSTSWTTCMSTFASLSLRCSHRVSAWRRSARRASRYTIAAPVRASRSLSKVTQTGQRGRIFVCEVTVLKPQQPQTSMQKFSTSMCVGFCFFVFLHIAYWERAYWSVVQKCYLLDSYIIHWSVRSCHLHVLYI